MPMRDNAGDHLYPKRKETFMSVLELIELLYKLVMMANVLYNLCSINKRGKHNKKR